jgi:hypothetical protein
MNKLLEVVKLIQDARGEFVAFNTKTAWDLSEKAVQQLLQIAYESELENGEHPGGLSFAQWLIKNT